jgi:cell division protein FtsA
MGDFILDVPVRRGLPEKVGGLVDVVRQPSCATVVGVLMYGLSHDKERTTHVHDSKMGDWTHKMKSLLGM